MNVYIIFFQARSAVDASATVANHKFKNKRTYKNAVINEEW